MFLTNFTMKWLGLEDIQHKCDNFDKMSQTFLMLAKELRTRVYKGLACSHEFAPKHQTHIVGIVFLSLPKTFKVCILLMGLMSYLNLSESQIQ